MAEIDAFFKTRQQAEEARTQIEGSLPVSVSEPVMVTARNGRPWEITVRSKHTDLPDMSQQVESSVLSLVTQHDGEVHTAAVSGSRFTNGLPQSVIDRFEASQNS